MTQFWIVVKNICRSVQIYAFIIMPPVAVGLVEHRLIAKWRLTWMNKYFIETFISQHFLTV